MQEVYRGTVSYPLKTDGLSSPRLDNCDASSRFLWFGLAWLAISGMEAGGTNFKKIFCSVLPAACRPFLMRNEEKAALESGGKGLCFS